jgi:hypothetical protein
MPKYKWDSTNRRYLDSKGHPVPDRLVRKWIDEAVDETKDELEAISEQLNSDEIEVNDWKSRMSSKLRTLHIGASLIAIGGAAQLTQHTLSKLSARVSEQEQYLLKFTVSIEVGVQQKDASLVSRAAMYADAGVATYENIRRGDVKDAGFEEERSILDEGAHHCIECPDEAGKGWQPLASLIPIGGRECMSRCRCSMEYRKRPAGSDPTDE